MINKKLISLIVFVVLCFAFSCTVHGYPIPNTSLRISEINTGDPNDITYQKKLPQAEIIKQNKIKDRVLPLQITSDHNKPFFTRLVFTILYSYTGTTENIIIKCISYINWMQLNIIKKITAYRSVKELMPNLKKHSQSFLSVIHFTIARKKIKISYTDNSRGATNCELLSKNGLLNIKDQMISLNGIFTIETNPGFHITLTYPIPLLPYV